MAIQIMQDCDGCPKTRSLKSRNTTVDSESDGWRIVPVNRAFGNRRDEQPTLCPDCQDTVLNVIRMLKDGYAIEFK